jgi:taurine dioxygenase
MEATASLQCRPLTSALGGVIEGVDLRRPLSPTTREFIHQAILDRGVVFFRGQDGLTREELAAFVSNFGAPQTDPLKGKEAPASAATKEMNMAAVKQVTALWHSDFSFFDKPPIYTCLRSVKLPQVGGDTCWASLYAAYEALSEPLRNMLERLTAVHSHAPTAERLPGLAERYSVATAVHGDLATHPVVIVHPETGRKALFVFEGATLRIAELGAAESRHLLALLFEHLRSPLFSMRWTWKPNDVALWDNRVLQHYAVPDYTEDRVMQTVRTVGQRPVGVAARV